ncbi:TonB-dependent receptor [Oceanicoccus sp. KOV_DT_Chl]|uniref:TonB-dependent receptor n=1 Tax=Oceanicoccus sp. KOV_DT_Chl TaxID=1904639 RepID=UPI000C7A9840|nr:TonB-dependent receptor [Oceanicoccus sp. KOV_DT_Chl]
MIKHSFRGSRVVNSAASVLATAVTLALTSTAAQAQNTIEEIIVTAQKQMETLQDVPIAVTAFSERDLNNLVAQDIADVGEFAPNVDLSRNSTNQPSYTIRGIGTRDFGVGADPAVGVYIDGVYIGRAGASKVAFNDIQRVEILNGPQGTLFGRNAAAGAVQYITNKPIAEEQGWVKATLGNYDKRKLEGVYNIPLADNLYLRTGALWNERDGDVDNVGPAGPDTFNGEDNWSITSSLAWYPKDELEIIARFEYDELDTGARAQNSATVGPRDGKRSDFDKVASDDDTYQTRELFGASVHISWEFEEYVLTSITAYREFESAYREERDGSADPLYKFSDENFEDNASWNQELRINTTTDGPLNFTVGVNYSYEDAEQTSSIFFSPTSFEKALWETVLGSPYAGNEGVGYDLAFSIPYILAPGPNDLSGYAQFDRIYASGAEALMADEFKESFKVRGKYKSYAAFADATYAATEDLDVTLGVRWTRDEKDFSRFSQFNDFGIGFGFPVQSILDASGNLSREAGTNAIDPFNGTLGWYDQSEAWEEVTPRAVVDYRITEDILTYLSYSEGYKAGGFNSVNMEADSFDPENVKNLELGFKTSWLDYSLRVNGAIFLYEYENLQKLEEKTGACTANGVTTYEFDTFDVEGEGFELSAIWIPVSGLTLSFNTGNLDAEYTRRIIEKDISGSCTDIDEKGESFSETPDLNYSLGINYAYFMDSGAELNFNAAYNYKDSVSRESCKFVEENTDGSVSVYGFDTIDGVFQQINGGAGQPDFVASSCPDQPERQLLNLKVTYMDGSGDWEVATYVLNATDEHGDVMDPGGLGGSLSSSITDGSPTYTRDNPRLYGVEFKYNF